MAPGKCFHFPTHYLNMVSQCLSKRWSYLVLATQTCNIFLGKLFLGICMRDDLRTYKDFCCKELFLIVCRNFFFYFWQFELKQGFIKITEQQIKFKQKPVYNLLNMVFLESGQSCDGITSTQVIQYLLNFKFTSTYL